jgi:hypothetical protein
MPQDPDKHGCVGFRKACAMPTFEDLSAFGECLSDLAPFEFHQLDRR